MKNCLECLIQLGDKKEIIIGTDIPAAVYYKLIRVGFLKEKLRDGIISAEITEDGRKVYDSLKHQPA